MQKFIAINSKLSIQFLLQKKKRYFKKFRSFKFLINKNEID